MTFALAPRILADTAAIASLGLSELRLMDDARFPWLMLVPRKAGAEEIIDLDAAERAALTEEIALVSGALRAVTGCDKLNVGALGNIVRQLHIHVVARFERDAAWPGPVWGAGQAIAYEAAERDRFVQKLRQTLPA
ncbi:MAG: HIT domain-containing protein [Rhizobiales bacterium]|nr:HIT domain-containing protein [Hyphomicrobiales bacterium]